MRFIQLRFIYKDTNKQTNTTHYQYKLYHSYMFRPISTLLANTQQLRGLRRGSADARLLGLWVRIPVGGGSMEFCLCLVLCVVRKEVSASD
jgi:hypothetical protein